MKSLVTLAILVAVVSGDVSHLTTHYLPPNYHMQYHHHHHHPDGIQMSMYHNHRPSNERFETTIEKHKVIELPTQIEIIKEGQPIYGVHPQIRMPSNNNNNEHVPEIRSRYLPPSQEIENLQTPQVPYEMPMRTYLPPVAHDITTTDILPPFAPDTTTTDIPPTTTTMLPTTTDSPSLEEEETTTEQQYTTEQSTNNYPMTTTEMSAQEQEAFDTTTSVPEAETIPENRYLPPMPKMPQTQEQEAFDTTTSLPVSVTIPENRYLPSMPMMPQNHYLPPLGMMLPPLESMPQFTYQQYREQLTKEQQKEQMYREQVMQEMMNAISEMEQQQMITLESKQQPIAPVEPAHILREDGYHYKTTDDDDLRRYRYRL